MKTKNLLAKSIEAAVTSANQTEAQAVLAKLVEEGCLVQHQRTGTLHTVAYARLTPTAVLWSAIWPEDQHHTHRSPYRRATVPYGRDLALFGASGMTLYFAPAKEWPGLDLEGYYAAKASWDAALKDPATFERYMRFWASTLG